MAQKNNPVYPVRQLAQTAGALAAAVAECLEAPKIKAVHKVRTTTRRAEAQLTLLGLAGGFAEPAKRLAKLRKVLRKLRRAAGAVRDLDVQQDLIRREAETIGVDVRKASKEAGKLARRLQRRRTAEARDLEKVLREVEPKLRRRWKKVFDTLGTSAGQRSIPEAALVASVQEWYRGEVARYLGDSGRDPDDPDRLHSIRKAAKLARYLAETAGAKGGARALAAGFEHLQEVGGQWHDWMVLSDLAASELGESAKLPQRFALHAADALVEFRKRLA